MSTLVVGVCCGGRLLWCIWVRLKQLQHTKPNTTGPAHWVTKELMHGQHGHPEARMHTDDITPPPAPLTLKDESAVLGTEPITLFCGKISLRSRAKSRKSLGGWYEELICGTVSFVDICHTTTSVICEKFVQPFPTSARPCLV
jgi:hypothetical protein